MYLTFPRGIAVMSLLLIISHGQIARTEPPGFERVISEFERSGQTLGQELDRWSEQHGETWESWGERTAKRFQAWIDQQQVWSSWIETYQQQWSTWLQADGDGHFTATDFGDLVAWNLQALGDLPWTHTYRSGLTLMAQSTDDAPWESIDQLARGVSHELSLACRRLHEAYFDGKSPSASLHPHQSPLPQNKSSETAKDVIPAETDMNSNSVDRSTEEQLNAIQAELNRLRQEIQRLRTP